MNEDTFNMSVRKFLKKVGVTSQREIEQAVRDAEGSGKLKGGAMAAKATFTIGGSDGFQLDSIRVNSFSIFGVGATINSAASATRFLKAHIGSPFAGANIDRATLNAQHYIDVVFDDPNAQGLTGITDDAQESSPFLVGDQAVGVDHLFAGAAEPLVADHALAVDQLQRRRADQVPLRTNRTHVGPVAVVGERAPVQFFFVHHALELFRIVPVRVDADDGERLVFQGLYERPLVGP